MSAPPSAEPPARDAPGDPVEWREAIRRRALAAGFALAGFASAEPLGEALERRWKRRLEGGDFGDMEWLRREFPARTRPRDLFPEARSILVVAASYWDAARPEDDDAGRRGAIARYARGRDYHLVLRERLGDLARAIAAEAPARGWGEPVAWRAFADSAPLDERALAVRAGLGFVGKNALLIHPKAGSWFLLAELALSIPLPPDREDGERASSAGGDGGLEAATCGSCRACIEACPTDALAVPYQVDATRCLSYLTIEHKGPIPPERAARMEGRVFGCDVCQEVCPFNANPPPLRIPELGADRGAGPSFGAADLAATPSGKSFEKRWRETPLARAGRRRMERNLKAAGLTDETDEADPAD